LEAIIMAGGRLVLSVRLQLSGGKIRIRKKLYVLIGEMMF
jgi:hypothetical protein